MKLTHKIFATVLFLLLSGTVLAQDSYDFMRLSGDGITLWHGSYNMPRAQRGMSAHRLLTLPEGTVSPTDERTGNELHLFPNGENTVIQLGDTLVSGSTGGLPSTLEGIYPSNAIDYVFDVDDANSLLMLSFAVVLEDPVGGHNQNEKPLFNVKISDEHDVVLDDCAIYEISAMSGLSGFHTYEYLKYDTLDGVYKSHTVRWRDWTSIGIDLSPYSGGKVKVGFTTKDCFDGSHYAYTYFTARCANNGLYPICIDEDHMMLVAPAGYETYEWSSNGGNERTATFEIPDNGLRASCHLTSFTGCQCDLGAYILRNHVNSGTHILFDTTCSSRPYTYSNFDIEEDDLTPGDHVFVNTVVEAGECENVATNILQLNVADIIEKYIYADVCQIDGYHDDSIHIDNPEVGERQYDFNLISGLGCDSIVHLMLTVNETPERHVEFTKCQGDVFDFYYGENGLLSTTYEVGTEQIVDTIMFANTVGCDSVIVVTINVNPTYIVDISDRLETELGIIGLCMNETIEDFYGFTIRPLVMGEIDDTLSLTSQNGCDSIVTLHLGTLEYYNETEHVDACYGDSLQGVDFLWAGYVLFPPHYDVGHYIDTVVYSHIYSGCESWAIRDMDIWPVKDSVVITSMCSNQQYSENGFSFTPQIQYHPYGTYTPEELSFMHEDTLYTNTIHNCDSTVYLELQVNNAYRFPIYAEICEGGDYINDSLPFLNQTNPEMGEHVYSYNFPTVNCHCDSIYELTLNVKDVIEQTRNRDICLGDGYHDADFDTVPETVGLVEMQVTHTSIFDCDSIIYLKLNVHPVFEETIRREICDGEDYSDEWFNISAADLELGMNMDTVNPQTEFGCDNFKYLELFVKDTYYTEVYKDLCEGSTYDSRIDYPGADYSNTYYFLIDSVLEGDHEYEYTYTAANGCDSLVKLYVHGRPLQYQIVEGETCVGVPYTENGFYKIYDTAGYYDTDTLVFRSVLYGCDSTVFLHLTVFDNEGVNIVDSICYGEDYYRNGFELDRPSVGLHYETLHTTTQNSCEKTVNLTLNVYASDDWYYRDNVCWNDVYTNYGFNINVSERWPQDEEPNVYRIYNDTSVVNIHGCLDHIVVDLTVDPVLDAHIYESICDGESYDNDENGFHITGQSVGTQVYDTINSSVSYGCDSTTYLHLTVNPVYDIQFTEYIGIGGDYHGHGFDIISPEEGPHDYMNSFSSVDNCDSIVRLHLDVFPTAFTWVRDSICYGEDYVNYGFNYINPDVDHYLDTIINYNNNGVAVSVFYLDLDVNEVYDYTINQEICYGDDYTENGFDYQNPEAGHYGETKSLTTVHGCDSIVRLSLDVYPTFYTNATDSVCYGDVYVGPGFVINSVMLGVGRHQDTTTLETIYACDSIIYLDLTVLPLFDTVIRDTICFKSDYVENGFNIVNPSAGDVFDTLYLSTINGCDSTVYLELHVNPSQDTLIYAAICHGDDYNENGFSYIQPEVGTINDTAIYTNVFGCDSVVALELHVNPTFDRVMVDAICEGEDYNKYGFNIIAPPPGITYDTLVFASTDYCDSIVSLNLVVHPAYDTLIHAVITDGDDYLENGFSYLHPNVGIYNDSLLLSSEFGCDSTVRLNLTVMPVAEVYIEDTVCQGVDYLLEGFVIIHGDAGIIHDTLFLTNVFGGDSTVYLTLTVLPEYDTLFREFICFGDNYEEQGFSYIHPAPGNYIDTLRYETVMGCDSTVYLNLTVFPIVDSLVVAEICEGEDYIDNVFTVLHPSVGTYYDELLVSDTLGCTMYHLNLTVNPVNSTFLNQEICYGSSYIDNGFRIIRPDVGTVYDTLFLSNMFGCDSIVYLELLVNPVYEIYITDSICYGEDYDDGIFTILHPEVCTIHDSVVMQTVNGCDSTFYLTLTVNPVNATQLEAEICYGEDYNEYGFYFEHPDIGLHYDTMAYNNVFGCDSIVSIELLVHPVFDTLFVDNICEGSDYMLHGFEIISPSAGHYFETLYLTTIHGCDSVVSLDLTVNPVFATYFEGEICYGEDYSDNGFNIIKPEVGVHNDSIYLSSIHGCDSVLYLTLTVHPVYETWYNEEICYGDDYSGHGFEFIHPSVGVHRDTLFYQSVHGCDSLICMKLRVWPVYNKVFRETICHGESYTTHGFNIINPPVGMTYDTLFLESIHGCDSIVRLVLEVLPILNFGYAEISGHEETYVSTNLQTGRYKYTIERIPNWNQYQWVLVDNHDWVVETNGPVCYVNVTTPGTYTLKVIAENACSHDEREIIITGRFYDIDELEIVEADVYPNPAKDMILIESTGIVKITMLGLHGQMVKIDEYEGDDRVTIDVNDLPRGSYILKIDTNKGVIYKNVIIDR